MGTKPRRLRLAARRPELPPVLAWRAARRRRDRRRTAREDLIEGIW